MYIPIVRKWGNAKNVQWRPFCIYVTASKTSSNYWWFKFLHLCVCFFILIHLCIMFVFSFKMSLFKEWIGVHRGGPMMGWIETVSHAFFGVSMSNKTLMSTILVNFCSPVSFFWSFHVFLTFLMTTCIFHSLRGR